MAKFPLSSFESLGRGPWGRDEGTHMTIEQLLREEESTILEEACRAIAQLEHYQRDGEEVTRRRMQALYRHVLRVVQTEDLHGMRTHAGRIAPERIEAGFDLSELQTAFSVLEAVIWRRAAVRLGPSDLASGLRLVTGALGEGKDALGRAFVSLSPRALNASALTSQAAEELVYPV